MPRKISKSKRKEQEEDIHRIKFIQKVYSGERNDFTGMTAEQINKLRSWCYNQLAFLSLNNKLREQIVTVLCKIDKFTVYEFKNVVLEEVKKDMHLERENSDGVKCPLCDRLSKIYKRSISKNMCDFLISLIKGTQDPAICRNGWIHHKNTTYDSRDYPWVAQWGLAETQFDEEKKKRTSGMWRPTELGIKFAKGEIKVPKYIFTYNGKVTKVSDEMVSFTQAYQNNKFNYDKFMKGEI